MPTTITTHLDNLLTPAGIAAVDTARDLLGVPREDVALPALAEYLRGLTDLIMNMGALWRPGVCPLLDREDLLAAVYHALTTRDPWRSRLP